MILSDRLKRWWPEICVGAGSALLLLSVLSFAPFFSRGEAREALVAYSMWRDMDLILPAGYGGEVPSKPPMLHWLITLIALLFGMAEFAARAPSAIFSGLFVGLYFGVLRRLRSNSQAAVCAGLLLFSFEWLRAATTCRVDLVHSSSLAAGWIFYYLFFTSANRLALYCGATTLTVAILAKGPVAVILLALLVVVWEGWHFKKLKGDKKRYLNLIVWLFIVPFVVAFGWYLLAYLQGGDQFVAKFMEENLSRFLGTMKKPAHVHHWSYLVFTGFLGLLPLSLVFIPALYKLYKEKKLFQFSWFRPDQFFIFSAVVVIVVFVFYALPSSKRSVYLLVAYPFMILCAVDLLWQMPEFFSGWARRFHNGLMIGIAWLYTAVAILYCIGKIAGYPYTVGTWHRYPLFVNYLVDQFGKVSQGGVLTVLLVVLPLVVIAMDVSGGSRYILSEIAIRLNTKTLRSELSETYFTGLRLLLLLSALYLAVQGGILQVIGNQLSSKTFAKAVSYYAKNEVVASYGQEFYALNYYALNCCERNDNERLRFKSKFKPFFFDEWVLVSRRDLASLKENLGEGQDVRVVLSDVPFLKDGRETLLGQVIKVPDARVDMKGSYNFRTDLQNNIPIGRY
jgi:4-amino-4-deoxy-L-arabinose transferase-like glycosyltransferase